MEALITTVVGGLIVAFLVWIFGWSGAKTKVVVQGVKIRRTGKWMMLFSVPALLWGLSKGWHDTYGLLLICYGGLFLVIGYIVAWFQKL